MKIPRDLSGRELVRALSKHWDYRVLNQVGSHVILQTETPDHSPLRVGTLNAILRQVAEHKGATREDILDTLG